MLDASLIQKELAQRLGNAFDKQIEFISDPSKQKVLFCTRRSAKSFTAGLYLVLEALTNPGCNCLFVGLTRQSAKAIIWKDILQVINQKFQLNASFNQTELIMTLQNGSVIAVTGVDVDENEMNKLLGRKYRLVTIDEASMYTIDLRNLVYGVLGPAMVDPNVDGLKVLKMAKEKDTKVKAIMVTALRDEDMKHHALALGASEYVTKPFSYEKLETLIIHMVNEILKEREGAPK